jgi:hypothetical protein
MVPVHVLASRCLVTNVGVAVVVLLCHLRQPTSAGLGSSSGLTVLTALSSLTKWSQDRNASAREPRFGRGDNSDSFAVHPTPRRVKSLAPLIKAPANHACRNVNFLDID